MASCKDCLYVEVCPFKRYRVEKDRMEKRCSFFKDRSRFVELPDVGDYDTVTNIDEAIVHCRDKAADDTICEKCREEHAQLAVWLEELKVRRMNDLNRKNLRG